MIVTNHSDTAVDLNDANRGCEPTIGVALASRSLAPELGGHVDVCRLTPLRLPPGPSRFSVQVQTTEAGCIAPRDVAGAGPSVKQCSSSGPAPLPAGRYALVLGGYNLAVPEAPVVYVDLVAHQ